VVLPNGEIINTGSHDLSGQGSGYNLNWLFVGGEGTLGIITKATLKIIPKPTEGPYHISYSFSDVQSFVSILKKVVSSRLLPHNIAFGDRKHFEILSSMGKTVPKGEIVLCIALEGEKGIIEFGLKRMDELITDSGGAMKTCDGKSHEECQECTLGFRGGRVKVYPVPGEIFVGLSRFGEALPKIYELLNDMKLKAGIIGSMVDRRTVMIMPYYLHDEEGKEDIFMDFHKRLEKIANDVGGRRVGLGLFFSNSINNIHSTQGVALMRSIKRSIDPHNIMNPGKTLG
jgi:FAD/FMN-containing dehydrogenase